MRAGVRADDARGSIVGESRAFKDALELARRFAPSRLPVLLIGDTGTGKEALAHEIHAASGRRGRLVDVNCAALPRDVAESLLFGHRRGAFTGALETARGLIEDADGGTLFLDEVLSMPVETQAKLLRVLETNEIRAVGDTAKRRVDIRVIAAAQADVEAMIHHGTFRADLLQRLGGVVIRIPALIDRRDDVVPLARHFASAAGCALAESAYDVLLSYDWPGNVRELKLAIERACHLSESYEVPARIVADSIALGTFVRPSSAPRHQSELLERPREPAALRERVIAVCAANDWNAGRSARALGLGRTTFFKRLKELDISLRAVRTSMELRIPPV